MENVCSSKEGCFKRQFLGENDFNGKFFWKVSIFKIFYSKVFLHNDPRFRMTICLGHARIDVINL